MKLLRLLGSRWRLVVSLALFGLIGWLLFDRAQSIDWAEVMRSLRQYDLRTVAGAVCTALVGYAALSNYDLLARRYAGHDLPTRRVQAIAFVGYSFTMNLGTFVGGMGFRYRLYSRYGLKPAQIVRLVAIILLTNWSGYLLLAGLAFSAGQPPLPAEWHVHPALQRALGALLLSGAAGYVLLCRLRAGRMLSVGRLHLRVPPARFALAQLALSSLSWLMVAATLAQLLPQEVAFTRVLATLFVSSLAGVVAHIPGNLGVLEGVCLALLGDAIPAAQLLAALLAFRAIYYLLPFAAALVVYAFLEVRAGRLGHAVVPVAAGVHAGTPQPPR
ncbi:MAG TPA: lysylphosphatidylglycerol synthase domain-containing protein [Solimonas sp.]|nr:lysylphosphatidylglycerol synthase domain-containing protein [Solimonas sp.]